MTDTMQSLQEVFQREKLYLFQWLAWDLCDGRCKVMER